MNTTPHFLLDPRWILNGRCICCDFINPDFAGISRANYGFGAKVEKAEELKPAVRQALAAIRSGVPALLDIVIDKNERMPK